MSQGQPLGGLVVCADVGSTFVKVTAVDPTGAVLARAQHPTTTRSDVLDGLDAATAALGLGAMTGDSLLVCSSAGGGLRLAVVGHERVISAEAGRRVALSAGARVVCVTAGELDDSSVRELIAAEPDVLLVVGGTDGGDSDVLLHNCRVLGRSGPHCPVVLAGNAAAADRGHALLTGEAGAPQEVTRAMPAQVAPSDSGGQDRVVRTTANVIPRIGVLHPGPARRAIRSVFIEHVIGGKGLSRGPRFADLVVAATPDAVLAGIEVVAEALAHPESPMDVLALDIGGATTDVYSVLTRAEDAPGQAVETLWHGRTVEGDLGMRWSAPGVVEAALTERLVGQGEESRTGHLGQLHRAAQKRHDDVGYLPDTAAQADDELVLARLAALVATRRHARPGPEGSRDLSDVRLLIGSGGVLRHADPAAAGAVLADVLDDVAGGWRLPRQAHAMVDRDYLLAPIGLLQLTGRAALARRVARRLVRAQLPFKAGTS